MSVLKLESTDFEKLQTALKEFQGNSEKEINEVLHGEGSQLVQDAIQRLMPMSGRTWQGKKVPAKTAKSLTDEKGNLYVVVKTTKNYQYLYFPDDGTNTRRHAGNQQFFKKGGESQRSEIIDRCVSRLVKSFET